MGENRPQQGIYNTNTLGRYDNTYQYQLSKNNKIYKVTCYMVLIGDVVNTCKTIKSHKSIMFIGKRFVTPWTENRLCTSTNKH